VPGDVEVGDVDVRSVGGALVVGQLGFGGESDNISAGNRAQRRPLLQTAQKSIPYTVTKKIKKASKHSQVGIVVVLGRADLFSAH